jgi:two-component system response regulator MtrA
MTDRTIGEHPARSEGTIVLSEQLTLDLTHRSVQRGSAVIALSELEWGIVSALLASRRPLSTNDLLEQVWHDRYSDPRQVWAVIGRLRHKLEPDPRNPRFLRRNRSFGYWLALPPHQATMLPKEHRLERADGTT